MCSTVFNGHLVTAVQWAGRIKMRQFLSCFLPPEISLTLMTSKFTPAQLTLWFFFIENIPLCLVNNKMYTQRRLTQLLYLFMLWQPVSVYLTIFRPLLCILKAYTVGKKRMRYH